MAEKVFIDVELVFLTKEEGGRLTSLSPEAYGGHYRPHIVVQSRSVRAAEVHVENGRRVCNEPYIAISFWSGEEPIPVGSSFQAKLLLTYYPNEIYDSCVPNASFTLREGHKIVGHGKIKGLVVGNA
jgi:hypothetical protein